MRRSPRSAASTPLSLALTLLLALLIAPRAERYWEHRNAPPELRAALQHEAEEEGEGGEGRRPFDQADEAMAFYVNKRTGPIVTRGPDVTTGARPLSPAAYLPALDYMRSMPRYSSRTSAFVPSVEDGLDPAAAAPGAALTTWTSLGPSNQGGRTRAILIDPGNPSIMYAGGVAGGVWKSTDAGGTWTPLAQLSMSNLAVVSLAFDPSNANTLYAGTGEGVFNVDAVRGAGIFRSTDAGVTWTQLSSTNTSTFHYTNGIAVSPRNTQRIYAATRTGFYRSINGGASWTTLATHANGCTQVVLQPGGATGYVFAACGIFSQGAVYRGLDDDASTFSSVLSQTDQGRSSIAIAPSDQATVYVMAAQATGVGGPGRYGLHGIYRSTSNGDAGSWTTRVDGTVTPSSTAQRLSQLLLSNPVFGVYADCGFGTTQFLNQGWYDNVIAVDPLDANRVWAGGIDLWRSDDGGVTWGTAGYWWFSKSNPAYHHADQHALVFHPQYNGTTNRILFAGSDGGVDRIDDARANVNTAVSNLCGSPVSGGGTWVDRNNGYVTTQFYHGAVYPDGLTYFGGLQDNGTQRGTSAGSTWASLNGGDGGYVAVDTQGDGSAANDVLFLETTGLSIRKSVNGGSSFTPATSGIVDADFLFIAPFAMNEGNRQQLWAGGGLIWRTTNQATSWVQASSGTCGTGSVSAMATHPLDGNRVIVGMSDGCYHYQTAALSASSSTSWPTGTVASAYISSVAWDPNDLNVAYLTLSRFGGSTLYKSTNGGATWTASMGSGGTALPQIPAHSVVVNPDDSLQVYVGTDLGVFTSVDGGASWYLENTGFANTPVEGLAFNETVPRYLYAFTHGRGAWRVALSDNPGAPAATADSYSTAFNTPLTVAAPGVLGNDSENGGGALSAVLDTTATSGTLVLNTNGGFTFTPAAGFSGPVTFTYHAANSGGSSSPVTVTITVNAGTPTTAADSYSTSFNTALNVSAPGVLANDAANGGSGLAAALVSTVSHGSLTLSGNGGFTYTPTTGYSGADSFTYRATNSVGNGNTVTVSLTVNAAVPTTAADAYSTVFNTTLNVSAPGVLANDAANGGTGLAAALVSTVSHGSLTLNGNGSFTYTPTTGFTGADSFTYRATSNIGTGNTVTVSLTVNAAVPTTVADSYSISFNTPVSVAAPGVLGNDAANGGTGLSAALVSTVSHGSLGLNANGSFSYTPATGYNGPDSFTYRAVNNAGNGNTVTVSITVNAGAPTTAADAYSTGFNTPLTVSAPGVLANDAANGGAGLTAVLVTSVSQGSLTLDGDGSFSYTPNGGFTGTDTFTYRAENSVGTGNTVTVSITVGVGVPTSLDDSYTTPFATPLNVAAAGVLANDVTNGGGTMTAAVQTGVSHGSLTLNGDGSFTYTPTAGYAGADSFTYRATNSQGPGNVATVSLSVSAGAPTTVADAYSTPFDTPLTVSAPGVLANDAENGGGAMSAVLETDVSHGTLALQANGSFTYTPASGYAGADSFSYRAVNGVGNGSPVTVSLTVGAGVPTTVADSYSTAFNTPLTVAAPGVLANDSSNGGTGLAALLVGGASHGGVVLNANGSFSYTATFGYSGADSFAYRATDSAGNGNIVTVSLTVNAGVPTTVADSYSTAFNTPLNVPTPGVLANDAANGGTGLAAALVSTVSHGTLALSATGGLTYTPSTGYSGPDSFTYRATSNAGNGNTVTVSLTVNGGVGAVPTTVADSYSTPEDTLLHVPAPGVLANDLSNGGGPLTAVEVTQPTNGGLFLDPDGSVFYVPISGFNGIDTFTYRATNAVGAGNVVTVSVTVGTVVTPPPPIAAGDAYSTQAGTSLVVGAPGVLGNDDARGAGAMTAVLATDALHGLLSLAPNGSFSYQPDSGFSGSDSFSYRASTSGGLSAPATVSISVAAPPGSLTPTDFRITAMRGNVVTFAWTPPTSGPPATGIQLEGGLAPGSVLGFIPLPATPAATIALPTGSFYLRLRAMTTAGLSAASNEILAHVNVPVPPSPPAHLLGLVNGGELGLAWTPTFEGGEPTGAMLDVAGAVNASLPLGPGETFSFAGVPPGSYTFSIRQTNASGSSMPSAPVSLSFPGPCTGAPSVPENFVAYVSGGTLFLNWDPPSSGAAPSSYLLTVSGAYVGVVPFTTRSFSTPVPPGTYNFTLAAANTCGVGAPTPVRSVAVP
ncbi:MAG: Ig-like domain-containing protein [Vicinamibacterales bacterium]